MKSKTVASIMRHVASKSPTVSADGTEVLAEKEVDQEAIDAKKARRAARKEGHEEDVIEEAPPINSNEEERLEQLYEQIAWPLNKKYGHPYDAFKLSLTYVRTANVRGCC